MKKKIYKVTFLTDKKNDWIKSYLSKKKFLFKNRYDYKFSNNIDTIVDQDILFIVNYTKVLSDSFLQKNRLNLVIHASDLPKDRGFAPVANQVMRGKNQIYISLIEANEKVDTGCIFLKQKFYLKGTDLYDEIRNKTAIAMIKIINSFLKQYPLKINSKFQKGKSNFNKKRTDKDNKLNINKSIKKQFHILRLSNNENFPAYFYNQGEKYILKIYKDNKNKS